MILHAPCHALARAPSLLWVPDSSHSLLQKILKLQWHPLQDVCCLDRYWSFCLIFCQVINFRTLVLLFCPQRCLVQVTFNPLLSDDVIKAEAVQLLPQKDDLQVFRKVYDEDNWAWTAHGICFIYICLYSNLDSNSVYVFSFPMLSEQKWDTGGTKEREEASPKS